MKMARILIVEDDYDTADFLNLLLSQNGYCVTNIVVSGEEAIETVLHSPPDLVLMDIKLEGHMDGIKACGQIKKSVDVPVIFVSAYSDRETIDRALQSGPSGYIVKPFKRKPLITEIEKALKRTNLSLGYEVEHAIVSHHPRSNQL